MATANSLSAKLAKAIYTLRHGEIAPRKEGHLTLTEFAKEVNMSRSGLLRLLRRMPETMLERGKTTIFKKSGRRQTVPTYRLI